MRKRAILLSAVGLSACYRYAPSELTALTPQESVVVELTDIGTVNVIPMVGNGVTFVEGRVVQRGADGLTVSLATVRRRGEPSSNWNGETLVLKTTDIRAVRTKELSHSRTVAALAGLTAAGTALVVAIARAAGGASSSGSRPGGPPAP